MKNYAFIDAQNLHMAILGLNWKIDYKKFRIYLREFLQIPKDYEIFFGGSATQEMEIFIV